MRWRPVAVETVRFPTIAGGYRPGRRDVVVLLAYGALAVVVLWPLWAGTDGAVLAAGGADQALTEWTLSRAAHLLAHGGNPVADPSVLGIGLPLAPLTLASGPTVALAAVLTLGLAGTATAWYWLLTRRVLPTGDAPPTGHLPAALAGGLIGFSPSLVGHAAGGHPQIVAQFLLPFIVWRALTVWRRPVRGGVGLGLLVTCQVFVGAEMLLIAAPAGALFLAVRAARRPLTPWIVVRRYAAGVAVATGVVLLLAGYPLWTFYAGAQDGAHDVGARLAAWTALSTHSLAGPDTLRAGLVPDAAEQNGFLGWSLPVVVAGAAVWLWRWSSVSRAVTVTAAVLTLLAFGSELTWRGDGSGVPGPWRLLAHLPVLGSVPPARFAMVVTVCAAVLLALALHRVSTVFLVDRLARRAMLVAVLAALLPLVPTPLEVRDRPAVPDFVADGQWRNFVRPGRTLVVAPRPDGLYTEPVRWQYVAGFGFRLNGDHVDRTGRGTRPVPERRSETLALAASRSGRPPAVSAADRAAGAADLGAWGADAVVVDPRLPHAEAVRVTVSRVYGVSEQTVGGMWVWDVRGALEAPPT